MQSKPWTKILYPFFGKVHKFTYNLTNLVSREQPPQVIWHHMIVCRSSWTVSLPFDSGVLWRLKKKRKPGGGGLLRDRQSMTTRIFCPDFTLYMSLSLELNSNTVCELNSNTANQVVYAGDLSGVNDYSSSFEEFYYDYGCKISKLITKLWTYRLHLLPQKHWVRLGSPVSSLTNTESLDATQPRNTNTHTQWHTKASFLSNLLYPY